MEKFHIFFCTKSWGCNMKLRYYITNWTSNVGGTVEKLLFLSLVKWKLLTIFSDILSYIPECQLNELIDQDVLTLLGWSPALKLTPYAKHFQFSCSSRFTRHFVMGYPGIPKTNSKSPKPNQKSPKTIPNLLVGLGWLWVGLLKSLLCYLRLIYPNVIKTFLRMSFS